MANENARPIRFLQQENAQLKAENQTLTEEVRALRRYIKALHRMQKSIQRFTTEQEVLALLDETLGSAIELLDAADGSLMLLDEETDELVFVLVHGDVDETLPGHRINRDQGVAGWAAKNNEIAIINDVRNDWRFFSVVDESVGFKTHSLIAAPLIARGNLIGVIEVVNKRAGEDFTDEDASALAILAALAAFALDCAALTEDE
jgi:Nif-specific regulatory protein